MDLLEIIKNRRSVRHYTGERIPEEKLNRILQAGLFAPSSRGRRPWEFIVVRDREMLQKLSRCRVGSAGMLAEADCAVVVVADETKTDVWVEDCSIVMGYMHLMADSLGVGSCWIQGRLRDAAEGGSTEEYVRAALGIPAQLRLEALLSLGMCENHPEAHKPEELPWEKVHRECY